MRRSSPLTTLWMLLAFALTLKSVSNLSSATNNRDINGYFQTRTVTFTSYYYNNNYTYPLGSIYSTVTYTNAQKNNYKTLYFLSQTDLNLMNMNVLAFISSQTNVQATFQINCPNGNYVVFVALNYLLVSQRFTFLQFQYASVSGTIGSSGNGAISYVINTNNSMSPTSQYMISYTGLKIYYNNNWDFMYDSTAVWGGSNSININISLMGYSNQPFMINFFVVHWNSTYFDNGFGNYGTFTFQNIHKTYSNSSHPLQLNSSQIVFYSVQKFNHYNLYYLKANFASGVLNIGMSNGNSINMAYVVITLLGTTNCTTTLTPYLQNKTCLDACPQYPILLGIYNYTCIHCLYDCSACTNTTKCSFCDTALTHRLMDNITHRCLPTPTYFDNGSYIAASCSPGCLTCNKTTVCLICLNQSWLITNYCTNIVGCTSVAPILGSIKCLRCNHSSHYALVNESCGCQIGFNYTERKTCEQVCGDSINISFQCDDGNIISGDGCSSSCKRQPGYICSLGSITSSSHCYYRGSEISLTLTSITKVANVNQALFVFEIVPNILLFTVENAVESLSFTADNSNITSYSFDKGYISFKVSYNEAIQNKMGSISIQMNSSHLLTKYLNLTFIIKSDDIPLLIYKDYRQAIIISYIISFITICVLGAFLVSLFSHKMIGVQLIHAFQMIYFLVKFDKNQTIFSLQMQVLTYTNFNFLYWQNEQSNLYLNPKKYFSKFNFSNLLYSQEILVAIVGIPSILLVIQYVKKRLQSRKKILQSKWQIFFRQLVDRFYNQIVFPFAIGFFYLGFSSRMQPHNELINYNLLQISIICGLFIIDCLVFFSQLKHLFFRNTSRTDHTHLAKYACFYILFTLGVQTVLLLGFNAIIMGIPLKILIIYLAWLILFIIWRPYSSRCHNIGQSINLMVVILWSGWLALKEFVGSIANQQIQFFVILALLPAMVASIVVSIIRIIKQIQQSCKKSKQEKRKPQLMKEKDTHLPIHFTKNGIQQMKNLLLPQVPKLQNSRQKVYLKFEQTQIFNISNIKLQNSKKFQERLKSRRKKYLQKE